MRGKTILPGATIGILGGGQLGRMTAIEAKKMGYDVICLDPTPCSPCGQVSDAQIVAPLDDLEAATSLAERCDVLIYEFENISVPMVQELEKKYYLPQKSRILTIAQDRQEEKEQIKKAGFPVAPFYNLDNLADLERAVAELGYPCILKTARGGYDGKGQIEINDEESYLLAKEAVSSNNRKWVLEKKISFVQEVSAIVARKETGEITVFPVAENIHRDKILYISVVPPRISPQIESQAIEIASEMAKTFQVVGLLAVEFFVTEQGIMVNEIAPRPHNSGHYTWEACYVSQFEQFVRAVCNLPFGSNKLLTPVVMVNILGENLSCVKDNMFAFTDNIKVHLYGKHGAPAPKRKMGHLIVKTDHPGQAIEWVNELFRKSVSK